ncbi:two-component system chemotaxis response regulator CheY [Sulfuritortus calidifontis]|uniref:Two-component system chemotaxis response regulator CheY n=1 Tax=Sulfuritortus calidifontis TaxID=1914471 RepID=A0A4R3JQJ7_9PROT|nr:response regulator [Sulfuritortus calidifontis]TCS69215.1 two-component system chemotaxis response regulator CheY [Sulfuritortus calidifontis]
MDKKPHGKVLIVDDDTMIRSLLKVILRSEGWDLAGEAMDGEHAIAMCKGLDPDIVCLDVMMPGMSGVDTLKALRKECPEVRVVMITSDSSTATVREAVSFGAMGYIIKPFNAKRVADALHQAMKATPEGGIG